MGHASRNADLQMPQHGTHGNPKPLLLLLYTLDLTLELCSSQSQHRINT